MAEIVFIGNSLTEWFDWQGRFPEHKVKNLGVAGETAGGLLYRMESIISLSGDPDFAFLMTGTNDVLMEDYEGLTSSYREILARLSTAFMRGKIVVQSILPVDASWTDNRAVMKQNEAIKGLARDFKAEYLDLFSLFTGPDFSPLAECLLEDGVHLSAKGYAVWANAVEGFLRMTE
ncbi:MAG: GDSL-type esterase/lipase family protein [Thermodesulfovibrionales bacterium]|nr:GDSL-type esterase/lipase family protein [Thermodesulfovibrionales bacterium]